jgi:hypothetical protein
MNSGLLKGEQASSANTLGFAPDAESGDQPVPSVAVEHGYDKYVDLPIGDRPTGPGVWKTSSLWWIVTLGLLICSFSPFFGGVFGFLISVTFLLFLLLHIYRVWYRQTHSKQEFEQHCKFCFCPEGHFNGSAI